MLLFSAVLLEKMHFSLILPKALKAQSNYKQV